MSYGIVPPSTRSTVRRQALLLLLLLVAVSCASLAVTTHKALQHVSIVGRQHFHEAIEQGSTSQGAANTTHSDRHQQQTYNASGQIRRILHVNYMSGSKQLLRDALKPLSHFRKEWWLSCKAHHPGWTHVFWDEAACEQLLQSSYPWFLDTWRALNSSVVLKSDAIRPFVLHSQGGVYTDLDTECITDMSPWLEGAQLVLQAELGSLVNNAQMASVPGHPLLSTFTRRMQAQVAAGKRWPLDATGPHLLSGVVRALTGNAKAGLPGAYRLADGSRLAVYGPRQWMTPCAWNDWTCAVQLARDRPFMKARARAAVQAGQQQAKAAQPDDLSPSAANLSAAGAVHQAGPVSAALTATKGSSTAAAALSVGSSGAYQVSTVAAVAAGWPVMLGVQGVAGVHHFSGSWLELDGSKSLSLRQEGVSGVLAHLHNGTGFVQQPCSQLARLPAQLTQSSSGSSTASASEAVPVCWEKLSAAAAEDKCTVLSIRTRPPCEDSSTGAAGSAQQQEPHAAEMQLQQWLAPELALAAAGCSVALVTETPLDLFQLGGNNNSNSNSSSNSSSISSSDSGSSANGSVDKGLLARISTVVAVLGVSADPFAEPPVHTLDTLVESEVVGTARLTLLLMNLPGSSPTSAATGTACSSLTPATASSSSSSSVLDVINALYVSSSTVLQRVDSLVLTLPAAEAAGAAQHKAFAAYQHLFQESGFEGFYHSCTAAGVAGRQGSQHVVLGLTRA